MADPITIAVGALVVGTGTTLYAAKEERKATNKANDEAKQIAAEQNKAAKQREDLEARRSRTQALRARISAVAKAQLFGVATGQARGGVQSSSLAGAVAAFDSQFGANQGFANQVNQLNAAQLELQQRSADSQSRLQRSLSGARSTGAIGQAVSSLGTSYASFKARTPTDGTEL